MTRLMRSHAPSCLGLCSGTTLFMATCEFERIAQALLCSLDDRQFQHGKTFPLDFQETLKQEFRME
jgi:hypothetical protein